MDTIRLTGMRFFALVGDLPHEREIPQPIVVDLEVEADLRRAAATDDLDEGVDYRDLHAAVAATMSEDAREAPHLLEALGDRIAARVLAIEGVERVVVRCRKPWAALGGPLDSVEVEIGRP